MKRPPITHITTKEAWQQALEEGEYRPESLDTQGFVHCSLCSSEQLLAVAHELYLGQQGLVLLILDEHELQHPLKFEAAAGSSQEFPHVYGPIPCKAVCEVLDFVPDAQGHFQLPQLQPPQRSALVSS